jgi:osmotically-inducible protein OsmY
MICERLSDDAHIDASDITVEVKQGKVTLSSTVQDKLTRWRVEEAVESIGIDDINNPLASLPPTGDRKSPVRPLELTL